MRNFPERKYNSIMRNFPEKKIQFKNEKLSGKRK
jgi:hypothetical protein